MITYTNQDKEKELIKTALNMNCRGLITFPSDNQIYNPKIASSVCERIHGFSSM